MTQTQIRAPEGAGGCSGATAPVCIEEGVVKVVWLESNKVIIIVLPSFYDTGMKKVQQLEEEGVKVVRILNTGNEEEYEEAKKYFDLPEC